MGAAATLQSAGDLERWSALTSAAVLVAYGARRRSVPALCAATLALPLAYRGMTGRWPSVPALVRPNGDTRVALGGDSGIHVFEAVQLEKPLGQVYSFWRTLTNLPQFMSHLESVRDTGDGRSHWIAAGPGGLRIEWTAEIINDVPNDVIAWRSLEGSDLVTAGSVHFAPVRGGRSTRVSVRLQYAAPAGRLGTAVARLFGQDPGMTIREDLRRLKQLLEGGEMPRADARVRGGRP